MARTIGNKTTISSTYKADYAILGLEIGTDKFNARASISLVNSFGVNVNCRITEKWEINLNSTISGSFNKRVSYLIGFNRKLNNKK